MNALQVEAASRGTLCIPIIFIRFNEMDINMSCITSLLFSGSS
jgi:hypothetical protein